MAALSLRLTATLPSLHTRRPPPLRMSPTASVSPPRGSSIVLRGFRRPDPLARNFENAIRLRTEQQKKVLCASERDSPNTVGSKQSSTSDEGTSDGPPVLTILAGIIMFLLVLWVIGSIATWIIGLVFGAAKS